MVFTLESHFDKEEKDILIKAHNINGKHWLRVISRLRFRRMEVY